MARQLTSQVVTELDENIIRPALLFEGDFVSGILRFWTGTGVVFWNGVNWEGGGLVKNIRFPTETTDVEATGIEVELSGVSIATIQLVLGSAAMGRAGKVWFALLDADGEIVPDPYLVFDGKFDTAEIIETPNEPEITIKYETRLIDLERGKDYRYTTECQKLFDATDTGFDYVPGLQDWEGFFGPKAKPPQKKDKDKNKQKPGKKRK